MPKRQSLGEDILDLITDACFYLPTWAIPVIAIVCSGGSYWAVDWLENGFAVIFPAGLTIWKFMVPAFVFLVTLLAGIKGKLKRKKRGRLLEQTNTRNELNALSWHEFELLIAETYRSEGYSVTEMGGSGPDGGIDLTATSPNGERYLIQCKHYKTSKVGVKIVREMLGVLAKEGGAQAVIVITGAYTKEAIKFAEGQPIKLIDGRRLIERIQAFKDHAPHGTTTPPPRNEEAITVQEPITCPKCGSALVERTAKRGSNAGNSFLGCSNFPKCRYTAS